MINPRYDYHKLKTEKRALEASEAALSFAEACLDLTREGHGAFSYVLQHELGYHELSRKYMLLENALEEEKAILEKRKHNETQCISTNEK